MRPYADAVSAVPVPFRQALRAELDALVAGERPELLVWVDDYPATLVRQPDEIWTHPISQVVQRADGSAWAVLPLWTEAESPSDLSAEVEVDPSGSATSVDVHVL